MRGDGNGRASHRKRKIGVTGSRRLCAGKAETFEKPRKSGGLPLCRTMKRSVLSPRKRGAGGSGSGQPRLLLNFYRWCGMIQHADDEPGQSLTDVADASVLFATPFLTRGRYGPALRRLHAGAVGRHEFAR